MLQIGLEKLTEDLNLCDLKTTSVHTAMGVVYPRSNPRGPDDEHPTCKFTHHRGVFSNFRHDGGEHGIKILKLNFANSSIDADLFSDSGIWKTNP
jgi:hypothetical protein